MKAYSVLFIIVFSLATNIFSQVQFTPHTITTNADAVVSVYAVDVDGDGDIDVLSAFRFDGKIAWYENLSVVGIVNNDPPVVPVKPFLYNNYPNPFNPSTSIQYAVSNRQFVSLKVYDVLGNEINTLVNEEKSPGVYEVKFDASNLASGVYIYQLKAGSFIDSKKLILIK